MPAYSPPTEKAIRYILAKKLSESKLYVILVLVSVALLDNISSVNHIQLQEAIRSITVNILIEGKTASLVL